MQWSSLVPVPQWRSRTENYIKDDEGRLNQIRTGFGDSGRGNNIFDLENIKYEDRFGKYNQYLNQKVSYDFMNDNYSEYINNEKISIKKQGLPVGGIAAAYASGATK